MSKSCKNCMHKVLIRTGVSRIFFKNLPSYLFRFIYLNTQREQKNLKKNPFTFQLNRSLLHADGFICVLMVRCQTLWEGKKQKFRGQELIVLSTRCPHQSSPCRWHPQHSVRGHKRMKLDTEKVQEMTQCRLQAVLYHAALAST